MAKLKELTVWMENKPGTLVAMTEALSKAKVNILAFMTDKVEGQLALPVESHSESLHATRTNGSSKALRSEITSAFMLFDRASVPLQ